VQQACKELQLIPTTVQGASHAWDEDAIVSAVFSGQKSVSALDAIGESCLLPEQFELKWIHIYFGFA